MMSSANVKLLVPVFFSLAITAGCLFGSAGRLDWWNAWVLLGASLVSGLAFIAGRDPELAAERRNVKGGKSWDKVLGGITVLLGPMAMWITAGLDDRFHWSNGMSSLASAVGVAAAMAGAALTARAMRTNRFFSAVVRIQKDRGHTVIEGGPYRYIRHPGYAGMSAFLLATPLILGSYCRGHRPRVRRRSWRYGRRWKIGRCTTSLMAMVITPGRCDRGCCLQSGRRVEGDDQSSLPGERRP